LSGWTGLIAGLALLAIGPGLRAQVNYSETNVTVSTIGGGPLTTCGHTYGTNDGNTFLDSQFDGPVSIALDSQGTLYIADKTNHSIRKVTQAGNTSSSLTSTMIVSLTNAPSTKLQVIGVGVDAADSLYVVTQGATNFLMKFNFSISPISALFAYILPSTPSALAVSLDAATNIFVAFTNGTILGFAQSASGTSLTSVNTIVTAAEAASVKWQPAGLAWRGDGILAVSDLFKNAIYLVAGTNNSVPVLYANTNGAGAGWVDGDPAHAQFNQPSGLAWSGDRQLVVADRSNNALRRIDASGNTSTIYGVTNTLWGASDCGYGIYAGWIDGGAGPLGTNAAGRAPAGVVIAPGGNVFVTELYYDLLREVKGTGLFPVNGTNAVTGTNGTTNVVLSPPVFSPDFGYYPECQPILVTSSGPSVFYTIDGTTPTTNSTAVTNLTPNLVNGQLQYLGSFLWCNSQQDLSSLQMISFNGTNTSAVAAGQSSPVNQIGFPAGKLAGIGSTAVIPLVVNLRSNQVLKSVQFRVEVTPIAPNAKPVSSLTVLPISTNDFVPLIGPAPGNAPVNYITFPDPAAPANGQGLAVLATGNNSGFVVQNFAVAMLLAVQIPNNAVSGDTYQLSVLDPSGTSDGAENDVSLVAITNRTLTVSNVIYFVGDSSPSGGYEAGVFGDGKLNNSDVNNALLASVGIHVPFTFTDAFNAMDVYPETAGSPGKGFITYLDAQIILFRSLGLDANNFVRFWSTGGVLLDAPYSWTPGGTNVPVGTAPSLLSLASASSETKAAVTLPPGQVWLRQAAISGGTVTNVPANSTASIPVRVKVLPGFSLAGLQFRAIVLPNGGAPAPGRIQFSPAAGIPVPSEYNGLSANETVCVWSLLDPFSPPLEGSNLLGSISFQVPPTAIAGDSYTLRFLAVGGAPDLATLYQLESVPGSAWVKSGALVPPQITSDEWRTNFFGSLTNPLAADNADADGDGVPNWQKYLAGTNPTNALSELQFLPAGPASGRPPNLHLNWLTAPGRSYVLESTPALGGSNWTAVNTNLGDGNLFQIALPARPGNARFYRIRLQP
jgi:hypothetical protein